MECKVDGCKNEIRYKSECLCQKHYFRQWRYGRLENKKPKDRFEDKRGYQFVYAPNHPLKVGKRNYIAEHRTVLYAKIGTALKSCEICGKSITWETCHVDHIDENKRNNDPSNLRPTCITCNTHRNLAPAHKRFKNSFAISYDGETKTATEWARDSRVKISHAQIRRRKLAGFSDYDALFAPKTTHKTK